MYHLHKLKEFRVNQKLQVMFYRSTIESIIVFGVAVWGGNVNLIPQDKKSIKRAKKCAEKILGS